MTALAAFAGTLAFSLLFGVPGRHALPCGAIGTAGWVLYAALAPRVSPALAILAATMLVALLSRFAAVWRRAPATVFLIAGIFPLVPGGDLYWTAYALVTGEAERRIATGFSALQSAAAIALGIALVFELPSKLFGLPEKQRRDK